MDTWQHLRAILLLPFMAAVVVPGAILWLAGADTFGFWESLPASRVLRAVCAVLDCTGAPRTGRCPDPPTRSLRRKLRSPRRYRARLTRLPTRLRQAVVLRYLEGLGQREGSAAVGLSQGTLVTRTREGLLRLRTLVCR